jgi:hypothetical protein
MSDIATGMIEKIENQLAQLILYIGSIDALSEEYRVADDPQNDPFLFGTVYDGLWDAAVVRIGTLWDERKGVASLPKLTKELERLGGPEANAVARQIKGKPSPEWERLKTWRHEVVAHSKFPLDPAAFDKAFSTNLKDLRSEAERIEKLVAEAKKTFGDEPVYFEVLKSDAVNNAKASLSKRRRNAA